MNYVSHCYVAGEVYPESSEAFRFGSMLPDFLGMTKTQINKEVCPPDILAGARFHLDTDAVFDSQEAKMNLITDYRPVFAEYLPQGAARVCADPGQEILLDGFTLQLADAVESYRWVIDYMRSQRDSLADIVVEPKDFGELLDWVTASCPPYSYQDPRIVADRLQRRVEGRRRLEFDRSHLPRLADDFALLQTDLARVASQLYKGTVVELSETEKTYTLPPTVHLIPGVAASVRSTNPDIITAPEEVLLPISTPDKRRAEFVAGRLALRQALAQAGLKSDYLISIGSRGEPEVPSGFSGSVSGKPGWVIAAAALQTDFASVGIDLERVKPRSNRLFRGVTTEVEQQLFEPTQGLVIGSAKEAAYKALYALTHIVFGFKDISLRQLSPGEFSIEKIRDDLAPTLANVDARIYVNLNADWLTSLCTLTEK